MGLAVATSAQYEDAVRRLFPQGEYWDAQFADGQSDAFLFVKAKAVELRRFRERMGALLDESKMDTTTELIADWERVYLNYSSKDLDINQRRLLIKSKSDERLNRAELNKIAEMYGFTLESIEFPYRPGFFGFSRFGDRLAAMVSFSVLKFTLFKPGLLASCWEIIKRDFPLKCFGRTCFGTERLAYFPLKDFQAAADSVSRFELMMANYAIAEKKLFAEFEEAIAGKLLANHIPIFYYIGD
jgi:uncharacterized protein YmfQ (DUF2313 family)